MKPPEEEIAKGVYYCVSVKMSHSGFCLDTFEKIIKEWLGDYYLVMKINPRVSFIIPLMVVG